MFTRVLTFGVILIAGTAQAQAVETFKCRGLFDLFEGKILLVAIINEDRKTGTIQVADTTHKTKYSVEGIERRWSWGFDEKDGYRYGFFISPDGGAMYYDFKNKDSDGLTQPSDFFMCEAEGQGEIERGEAESEALSREAQVLQSQLAKEADRLGSMHSTEMAAYQLALQQKVLRNWARPSSALAGLDCTVEVQQSATGEVLSADVVSCNGDAAVKRSIEAAVYKASPLPLPKNRLLFDPELRFRFIPEQ